MSRHELVTEHALVLPPKERNEDFEQIKLTRLRQIYGLHGHQLPKYQRLDNPYCRYKVEMHKLLMAFNGLAHQAGISGYGFRLMSSLLRSVPNYYQKDQPFYSNLKHALELNYVRMEAMQSGDFFQKRKLKTVLMFLERQIATCPGGLFTSTSQLAADMDPAGSELTSLEKGRSEIAKQIAEEHNLRYRIPDGNSSHTHIKVKKTAHAYGFWLNDSEAMARFVDRDGHLIPYSEEDDFTYAVGMYDDYSPSFIQNNLVAFYTERLLQFRNQAAEREGADPGSADEEKAEDAPVVEPRAYKNIAIPENRAELEKILQPLFETGVLTDIYDVVHLSEDWSKGWVKPEFLADLPRLIKEHTERQGYVLAPEMSYLLAFLSGIRRSLSDMVEPLAEEKLATVHQLMAEMMQLTFMDYRIMDGTLTDDGVERPCLFSTERGEAALHLMQRLYAQFMTVEQVDGPSLFNVCWHPLHAAIGEHIDSFVRQSGVVNDPDRIAASYEKVQKQHQRAEAFHKQMEINRKKEKVVRAIQARYYRKKFKRQYVHLSGQATRIQAHMRGYIERKVRRTPERQRVVRVINQLAEPCRLSDDRSKNLAYQLAFGKDLASPAVIKPDLLNVYNMPPGTALFEQYIKLFPSSTLHNKFCVSTDGTLHLVTNARWQGEVGAVSTPVAGGGLQIKLVRKMTQEELSRDWSRLIHLRLMRDAYADVLLKQWQPEWINQHNCHMLSTLTLSAFSEEGIQRACRITARILPLLPEQKLTKEVLPYINWWLNGSYKNSGYRESIFIRDLEYMLQGMPSALPIMSALYFPLVSVGTIEKLGGISKYTGDMLDVLKSLHSSAYEKSIVDGSYVLTNRCVVMVKFLQLLPKSQRDEKIKELNQMADVGCHPGVLAQYAVKPALRPRRAAPPPPVFGAAPAIAAERAGVFALKPFDRRMSEYIRLTLKNMQDIRNRHVRMRTLRYYHDKIDAWTKPYSKEDLKELHKYCSYLDYLCRSDALKGKAQEWTIRRSCKVTLTLVDRLCLEQRVPAKHYEQRDYEVLRSVALAVDAVVPAVLAGL